MTKLVPVERIDRGILVIRGQRVMLDADLAVLYGVSTKALNQAVKRNRDRFPKDFMFRLTAVEKEEVVTVCDHLDRLRFSPTLPYAFTEQGVAMLSSVLRSRRAVLVNIEIMRAFVRLRAMAGSIAELRHKVDALERKYDAQFKEVFDALRVLMAPPPSPEKPRIGFRPGGEE